MAMCGKKVKHKNSALAKRAMKKVQASGKFVGRANIYRCDKCGGWHWGRSRGDRIAKSIQIVRAIDRALDMDAKKRERA